MPAGSTRILVGWMVLFAVVLTTAASGAEPVAPVPPHPLVVVAEKVCHHDLPKACEELVKLAWASPGLTVNDSIRLLWQGVLRSLGSNDEASARKVVSQILGLDRSTKPPPAAPPRLGELLEEEARALAPSTRSPGNARSQAERDGKAAAARKPESEVLLGTTQALFDLLEIEGAAIVIEVARSSSQLTKAQRAQVAVWRGILKMELETDGETDARSMFKEALEMDGSVRFPDHVPPKTGDIFLEVKATVVPPPPPIAEPIRIPAPPSSPIAKKPTPGEPKPPSIGLKTWGVVVGGTGATLVAGGAVAGAIALSAYQSEKAATDQADWAKNRDTAGAAVITSNVLYGAGAAALGVGAILFLSGPSSTTVVPGIAPGKVSLTVGGAL